MNLCQFCIGVEQNVAFQGHFYWFFLFWVSLDIRCLAAFVSLLYVFLIIELWIFYHNTVKEISLLKISQIQSYHYWRNQITKALQSSNHLMSYLFHAFQINQIFLSFLSKTFSRNSDSFFYLILFLFFFISLIFKFTE